MSLGPLPDPARRGPLGPTMTLAVAVGLASVGLTQHLSIIVGPGRETPPRREARLARPVSDPEVTGSIGGAARSASLDPCGLLSRLAGARP